MEIVFVIGPLHLGGYAKCHLFTKTRFKQSYEVFAHFNGFHYYISIALAFYYFIAFSYCSI